MKQQQPYFALFGRRSQQLLLGMSIATAIYLVFPQYFDYPTFLYFNVLLSLQVTRLATRQAARLRVLGSIIGGVIGIICVLLIPQFYMIAFLPVGIIFAAYMSYLLLNNYVPIIVIIMMMVLTNNFDGNIYSYVFHRVFAALVGVSVALFVSYIFRSKARTHTETFSKIAQQLYVHFYENTRNYLQTGTVRKTDAQTLVRDIQKLRVVKQKILQHTTMMNQQLAILDTIILLFADYYMHLELISKISGEISEQEKLALAQYFQVSHVVTPKVVIRQPAPLNYHLHRLRVCDKMLGDLLSTIVK